MDIQIRPLLRQAPQLVRPQCTVNGRLAPQVMCGSVIVGGKFCGSKEPCEHKRAPTE